MIHLLRVLNVDAGVGRLLYDDGHINVSDGLLFGMLSALRSYSSS